MLPPPFTYDLRSPGDDLCQGDVLNLSDDLKLVLYPAFRHLDGPEKCARFVVLTQTCDLVRRPQRGCPAPVCKSAYISLAAMRPVATILSREVARYQNDEIERQNDLCRLEYRPRVEQFVERLLNNNAEGYFYFHDTGDTLVPEPMCAVLPESVSIKVGLYDTCRESRVIGLKPEFQAKLGWLIGSSYSQVATRDWVPHAVDGKQFRIMVEAVARANYAWPDGTAMKELKAAMKAGSVSQDRAAITEFLAGTLPRKERLLELIKSELMRVPELQQEPNRAEGVVRRIAGKPEFELLTRPGDAES